MGFNYNQIQPQDWVRTSKTFIDNTAELLRIRNKGSQVAAHVSTASTPATNALLFEQGATTGAAAGTTGTNPGTNGSVAPGTAAANTFHALMRQINAEGATDWEAWLVGALPDDTIFATVTNVWTVTADIDCTGSNGGAILVDSSVSEYLVAGLTFNGPDTDPHNSDSQVLHELLQVKATIGSTTAGTLTLRTFNCDDIAGTSSAILTIDGVVADTERLFPTDAGIGEPIASVNTGRLVVKLAAVTWVDDSADSLFILGRSYIFGPAVRVSKMLSSF